MADMALSPVVTCSMLATGATVLRVLVGDRASSTDPTAAELYQDFLARDLNDNGRIDPDEPAQTLGIDQPGEVPEHGALTVGRVVVAGFIMTGALLGVEQVNPKAARGVAALILLTSLLVNGVAVFDAASKAVQGAGTPSVPALPAPSSTPTPTSPPQSEDVLTDD